MLKQEEFIRQFEVLERPDEYSVSSTPTEYKKSCLMTYNDAMNTASRVESNLTYNELQARIWRVENNMKGNAFTYILADVNEFDSDGYAEHIVTRYPRPVTVPYNKSKPFAVWDITPTPVMSTTSDNTYLITGTKDVTIVLEENDSKTTPFKRSLVITDHQPGTPDAKTRDCFSVAYLVDGIIEGEFVIDKVELSGPTEDRILNSLARSSYNPLLSIHDTARLKTPQDKNVYVLNHEDVGPFVINHLTLEAYGVTFSVYVKKDDVLINDVSMNMGFRKTYDAFYAPSNNRE